MEPHEVLGVRPGASRDEVRIAFRRHAIQHHPDRGGDPETFMQGQQAFEALTGGRRSARRREGTTGPGGVPVQFHRRRRLGTTIRTAVQSTASRITRRPVPPPRVQ